MPDQPRPEGTPDPGTRPLPTTPATDAGSPRSTEPTGTELPPGPAAAESPQPTQASAPQSAEVPHKPEAGTAQAAGAVPPPPIPPPTAPGGGIPPTYTAAPPTYGGFPPPHRGAAVGRFARHKVTQLVAVGLLGLVLGGGLVAMFDRDGGHDRRGGAYDRPGHSRMDDRGGPGRDFRER